MMTIKKTLLLTALALMALPACQEAGTATPEPTPVTAALSAVEIAPAAPADDSLDPSDVRDILLAHHSEDLPPKAVLDRHPDAAAKLAAIATTDRLLIVRARALTLLSHYPDTDTRSLLLAIANDDAEHPKLRAAALHGLAGHDLTPADVRATVESRLTDPDPRVAAAAHTALR